MAYERPPWMAAVDLVLTGVAGPVVVAVAAVLGFLGDDLPLDLALTGATVAAAALLLLGALADQRRDRVGPGRGLLSPVPQALAAAFVVSVGFFAWEGALVPAVVVVGAALVAVDSLRRLRRGDLGPLRSGEELRRPLLVAGALVLVAGMWGLHGTWWTVDSSYGGGYEYGYHYDSYEGGYAYSYEYSPTANWAPGGSGGPGASDGYVVVGGVGLLVAGFALVRSGLAGRARWLPLAALAAPAAYLAWTARLTSGYGALVAWSYERAGWTFALGGVVLAVIGLVQVRRPAGAPTPAPGPVGAGAASEDPPPPF